MSHHAALGMKFPIRPFKTGRRAKAKTNFMTLPAVLLIVFSTLIIVDRLAVPQMPFGPDAGAYAVIGHELLQGQMLYTDIWDHKPPVIFMTYAAAELLFGYSSGTIVLLNLFANLLVLYGLFYAGKAGRGGAIAGLWAAAFWVIAAGAFQIEGRDPNTEIFINACVIWAFALLAKNREEGLTMKLSTIIGLLFTLGTFYKPVVVAYAIFLAGAHLAFPPGSTKNRKKALTDVLIMLAVGAVGWMLMFGYFAATGRFEIFYQTIVSYNSHYSGDLWLNITAPLHGRSELFLDFMNPVTVFAFIGIILVFFKSRRQSALLASFIAATWVAIALPGRFYVHYFQLWLPPLIVGASWAIGHFTHSEKRRLRLISHLAGIVLTFVLIGHQLPSYKSAMANDWSEFINPPLVAGGETARHINNWLADGETFFLWGNTPNLYFLTQRKPPAAVLFQQHLDNSPVSERLREKVAADLARERPEILVAESKKPPVPEWIARDYELMPVPQNEDTYRFYLRRGGRLAARFASGSAK